MVGFVASVLVFVRRYTDVVRCSHLSFYIRQTVCCGLVYVLFSARSLIPVGPGVLNRPTASLDMLYEAVIKRVPSLLRSIGLYQKM